MTDIIKTLKEMKEIDNCIKEIPCPDMETEPHRITLKRVKSIIFIKKHNDETKLRFNLKTKRMEKYYKRDKCWKYVQHQYEFFQGFRISDIITDEEKFKRIIELIKKTNGACSSLSTFIGRMGNALVYENYWDEKIQTIEPWDRHQLLTKPLNFYPKQAINLFKSLNIEITKRIEDNFIENKEIIIKILDIIPNIEITDRNKKRFLELTLTSANHDFTELIKDFNYDIKSLVQYLYNYLEPFENLDFRKATNELRDYYSMAKQIGREVKRYPKYLRSMHDIIQSNYNAYQEEYDEKLFKTLMKPKLNHKGKIFSIISPIKPKDIIMEGTDLNHCVGSYVKRILEKETYIFFLRKTEFIDQSLITLELKNNEIMQAKGSYNRKITEEERKYLEKYCKLKKLNLNL